MVRSFVGGIELIMQLLESTDKRVVASTCAALSMVATDQENLAIVSELGVVPILATLSKTAGVWLSDKSKTYKNTKMKITDLIKCA